jgi:hypothetical protein
MSTVPFKMRDTPAASRGGSSGASFLPWSIIGEPKASRRSPPGAST